MLRKEVSPTFNSNIKMSSVRFKILNFDQFFLLEYHLTADSKFELRCDILNLIWKDKSRRNIGVDEFQLTSKKFIIHPAYSAKESAETYDLCLIETPEDLSRNFWSIPCLSETFDLEKVETKIIQISVSEPEVKTSPMQWSMINSIYPPSFIRIGSLV